MKVISILAASVVALAGLAHAGSGGDTEYQVGERTGFKFECIETAIADELENEQFNEFVALCLEEKLELARNKRQTGSDKKS